MSAAVPLVVVDSSVAFKWLSAEGETCVDAALQLLSEHTAGSLMLAAPAHMPAEVVNGLRYAKLDAPCLHLAIEGLTEAEVVAFALSAELLSTALDLALAYDLTIHDALFPALAVLLDCELVTADRAQARVTECPVRLLT